MGLGGPHMSPPQQDPFLSTNLPHITMRNLISEMTARKGGQKKRQERSDRERHVEREAIEEQMAAEQMAAEEEADHKEASERDHAAYLEEAYRCRPTQTSASSIDKSLKVRKKPTNPTN